MGIPASVIKQKSQPGARDVHLARSGGDKGYAGGWCYGKIKHPSVQQAYRNAFRYANSDKQVEALNRIGIFKYPNCNLWVTPHLLRGLKHRDWRIRTAAAHAWGRFGAHGFKSIVKLLSDKRPEVRIAAARAFGTYKDTSGNYKGALSRLIVLLSSRLITSRDKSERAAYVFALGKAANAENKYKLKPAVFNSRAAMAALKKAVPHIVRAYTEGHREAKKRASNLLVALKDKRSAATLVKIFAAGTDITDTLIIVGAPAVPHLIPLLINRNKVIRKRARNVIEGIRGRAQPYLIAALKTKNTKLKNVISSILWEVITLHYAIGLLGKKEAYIGKYVRKVLLNKFDLKSVEWMLKQLLTHRDFFVREDARGLLREVQEKIEKQRRPAGSIGFIDEWEKHRRRRKRRIRW